MSELSSLSHEYASTADFSRAINDDVLLLKKQFIHGVNVGDPTAAQQSAERLGALLRQLLYRLDGQVLEYQSSDMAIPEDVIVRIESSHLGDRSYFVSDLTRLSEALLANNQLDENDLKLLDSICEAADASASATFRKLWRRQMATLLAELLHDLGRRAGEIHDEFARLRGIDPPAVEAYRERMQQRAGRAKLLVDGILSDPDLAQPILAVNYFRDFRDIARLVQELENLPLLVLRRFKDEDQLLTRIVREICREVAYPYEPPVCSSLSSQYYWTVAGMDLVFVPTLEPERILGLADILHELGHIVLYREERGIVLPGYALVDRHFDAVIQQGQLNNWPSPSLLEVQQYAHRWRTAWLLEFGADLIATYLCGPSFGWCNIRTSTNIGGEIFRGNESHPADDARAASIGIMLTKLGEHQAAAEIGHRWMELVSLSGETKPSRYDLVYPSTLLNQLCDLVFDSCQALGLKAWSVDQQNSTVVCRELDRAWSEFRLRPATFEGFERDAISKIKGELSS